MTDARLSPVDDDLDTGPFFQAARRGELVVQRCDRCDAVLHVPRARCHTCGSWDTRWQPVSGRATLLTWTGVAHQVHPAYPPPYTVVLVELDDCGAHLVGSVPGTPSLRAGQPMEVWFDELPDGVVLPNWRPVGADDGADGQLSATPPGR
ncbi:MULTISPECIES: Zn-ribbon domain-containing OB-fold protein [unclassified Blastococcus]